MSHVTIEKEVPYNRYLVHPVDQKTGEVDYGTIEKSFEDDRDDSNGFWRITAGDDCYIDSITDDIEFDRIKKYVDYLEGWFETHDYDDGILFSEWSRGDDAE